MKVLFISYGYEPGWTYQENLLPKACIANGHEVLCVASDVGIVGPTNENKLVRKTYDNDESYVKRLDTIFYRNLQISVRVRYLRGLDQVMEEYEPEVIFLHSMQTFNLRTLADYKKKHPAVKIYYNSHTDYYTSATNWLSMTFLHKLIYKTLLHKYMDLAEKFFYVVPSCGDFLWNVYKIPKEKTELLHLGGTVQGQGTITEDRESVINELLLPKDAIIFMQAGKMDEKKCLLETLESFTGISDPRFVLVIVGSIKDSIKKRAEEIIDKDSRIHYVGWKKDDELIRYLCAADVYIQPGKVSAIMQTAICCSCAIIGNNLIDYRDLVDGSNGWLIDNTDEIASCMEKIRNDPNSINSMKEASFRIALDKLEQRNLVKKFTGKALETVRK